MKTEIVPIGNSRGIRIPKPLIEQCKLGKTVEWRVEKDRLIVSAARRPRQGWEEAFRAAGSSAADEVLIGGLGPNQFDDKEWKW